MSASAALLTGAFGMLVSISISRIWSGRECSWFAKVGMRTGARECVYSTHTHTHTHTHK